MTDNINSDKILILQSLLKKRYLINKVRKNGFKWKLVKDLSKKWDNNTDDNQSMLMKINNLHFISKTITKNCSYIYNRLQDFL